AELLQALLGQRAGAVERPADAGGLGTDAVTQFARFGHDFQVRRVGPFGLVGLWFGSGRHGRNPQSGVQSRRAGVAASPARRRERVRRARPSAATAKINGYSFSKYHSFAK